MNERSRKLNPLPRLRSDEVAHRFVEETDLTEYDLSGFRRVRFIFDKTPSPEGKGGA